jgi:cell division initiation protein
MEMSPQQVRNASFKSARRGFDPDEVQTFLREVAESLEAAQNQSTAMEARARAAVARLQEVSTSRESQTDSAVAGDTETISRTLLLAQRTADATVSEAKADAERIVAAAQQEAATTIDSTREMSARLLEEARTEARQVSEVDRKAAQSEVESLLARRDFLESDVNQLENFLVDQRDRLRQAASSLIDLSERVPGGLGAVRRPLLSASDEPAPPLESRKPGKVFDSGPDSTSQAGPDVSSDTGAGSASDAGAAIAPDAGPDTASGSIPGLALGKSPESSSLDDEDQPPATVDDETAQQGLTSNETADEKPFVATRRAPAEPDDEPQFRFGIGETRRRD